MNHTIVNEVGGAGCPPRQSASVKCEVSGGEDEAIFSRHLAEKDVSFTLHPDKDVVVDFVHGHLVWCLPKALLSRDDMPRFILGRAMS